MYKKCVICERQLLLLDFGIKDNSKEYKTCKHCRELRKIYYDDKCKDENSLYLNPKILKEKRNNSKTF